MTKESTPLAPSCCHDKCHSLRHDELICAQKAHHFWRSMSDILFGHCTSLQSAVKKKERINDRWVACEVDFQAVHRGTEAPWSEERVTAVMSGKGHSAARRSVKHSLVAYSSLYNRVERSRWNEVAGCESHVRESPISMAMTRK